MRTTPQLELVSAKNTATTYSFQTVGDSFKSWALCTVNDSTGELNIQSDWGNWAHRWHATPESLGAPTLTAFIARGNIDYLARKLHPSGRSWSAKGTARQLCKRLCERRLAEGRKALKTRTMFPYPSRNDARLTWNLINETAVRATDGDIGASLFYERLMRDEGFTEYVTEEPWEYAVTEQTSKDKALRDVVLPALIAACHDAVAAAARAARPPCTDLSPPWFKGRWADWHRGHGCDLDDGKPRSAEAEAEIGVAGGRPITARRPSP